MEYMCSLCDWNCDVCSSYLLYIVNEMTFSGYNVYSLNLLYIIAILLGILVIISKNPVDTFFGGKLSNSRSESTRLNSSHTVISYAVFCLKKKNTKITIHTIR